MNTLTPRTTRIMFIASIVLIVLSLAASAFSVTRVLSAPLAAVTVPNKVGFEGFLADSNGSPLADATYPITFTVYDASGSVQWWEPRSVTVTKGLYAVELGSATPMPTNLFNGDRWIGVKVGSDPEMTPRTKVSSVPFALNAESANNADKLGGLSASAFATGSGANGQVAYWSTGALTGSNNLTFDGTRLTASALTVDTSTLAVDPVNHRVGIGTAAPGALLDVAGSGAMTRILGRTGSQATNDTLYFGSSNMTNFFVDREAAGGATILGYNTPKSSAMSGPFQVFNNSTDRNLMLSVLSKGTSSGSDAVILAQTSGNVGIGTAAPGALLDVAGSGAMTRILGRTGSLAANDTLYVGSSSMFNFFVDREVAGGATILGYNTPKSSTLSGPFQVYNNSTDRNLMLQVQSKGTSSGSDAVILAQTSGNVGIGTTSPQAKLDIVGAGGSAVTSRIAGQGQSWATSDRTLLLGARPGGGWVSLGFDPDGNIAHNWDIDVDTSGNFRFWNYTSSWQNPVTFLNSGNVGIGTGNPQAKLHVSGVTRVDTLGSAGSTPLCYNGSNEIASCSSSLRYKDNVVNLDLGLATLAQLRPVTFAWRSTGEPDLGFVAEEVSAVAPLLTTRNAEGQIEGVKYDRLTAVLVKAAQEQQEQIASLKAQNAQLEARLAALERASRTSTTASQIPWVYGTTLFGGLAVGWVVTRRRDAR